MPHQVDLGVPMFLFWSYHSASGHSHVTYRSYSQDHECSPPDLVELVLEFGKRIKGDLAPPERDELDLEYLASLLQTEEFYSRKRKVSKGVGER